METYILKEDKTMNRFKKMTLDRDTWSLAAWEMAHKAAIARKVFFTVWGVVTILGWILYFLK